MNYPIKSVVDQRALSELIKSKADLGDRRYEDISELVDDLIAKESELLEIARQLLSSASMHTSTTP